MVTSCGRNWNIVFLHKILKITLSFWWLSLFYHIKQSQSKSKSTTDEKNMRTECANKWKQRTFLHTWKKCKRKEIPQIAITVYAQLVATTIFHFESDPELAIQSKSNQIFKTETITTISMIREKKLSDTANRLKLLPWTIIKAYVRISSFFSFSLWFFREDRDGFCRNKSWFWFFDD